MSPLSPQHTTRSRDVFNEALERPQSERDAFISAACADDPAVGVEVRELLAAFEHGQQALEPISTQTPFTPPPRREQGSRIGRYHIRRLIGSGGWGRSTRPRRITPGGPWP